MQAACAHAVPQVTALLSPGHAARPLTARTALLPAPLRGQCTQGAAMGDKSGNQECEFDGCETTASFGCEFDGAKRSGSMDRTRRRARSTLWPSDAREVPNLRRQPGRPHEALLWAAQGGGPRQRHGGVRLG